MAADYSLVSRWSVPLSREDLWDVLDALLATPDPMVWWPAVQVSEFDGSRMHVRVDSPFAYSLRFALDDLTTQRPGALSFTATGDLEGHGAVAFEDGPGETSMVIDWRVDTRRRWMRWTSWALRPLFVLAHRQVMRQGERHFNAWIAAQESPGTPDMV
ncbi:SRPBCC family protein [Aeromicrobium wangtongii]|uniref:Polyketide cyclase / dehydrase and lipid transport n=1 Tax=Aeromicrobium wangtongii TaxID=2969247 RepID=A0ABY5M3U0_9ACTN|nr:hypothetical protein [Aeromicrobium wangtongii]MCD9198098.1 hypothetical protein [Aeromicrobium wangtongii]UUP12137.1 hypothetical protein NQV15_09720 [Aeromicrobium wangtongii]